LARPGEVPNTKMSALSHVFAREESHRAMDLLTAHSLWIG